LASQIPGGMLSNLESQLKEQGAADKMDEVLKEIAVVQKDAGYPPLVTPTSQIVGTQSVFNVLFGRYARLSGEFQDLMAGKYGACPAPKNAELVRKALGALGMGSEITHRPADDIPDEYARLEGEARALLGTAQASAEDVLTYAMFPKVAPGFFKTRADGPVAFSGDSPAAAPAQAVAPSPVAAAAAAVAAAQSYSVSVNGVTYSVTVAPPGAALAPVAPAQVPAATVPVAPPAPAAPAQAAPAPAPTASKSTILAPVAGTILRHAVDEGAEVQKGQTVLVIESMKMELEIKTTEDGKIRFLEQAGAKVASQQALADIC